MRRSTARLVLQSWSPDDVEEAFSLWGDPRVMDHVGPPHPDRERSQQALAGAIEAEEQDGCCLWRLTTLEGAALGCCGFHRYEGPGSQKPGTRWWELAYHLRPEAWGQGYATEAARACLTLAAEHDVTHVVAFTAWENIASRRLLDGLGFSRRGAEDDQCKHRLLLGHAVPTHRPSSV